MSAMLNAALFQEHLFALTPQRKFLVAISAGMDSSVLLHLMVQLRPQVTVRAMHVCHGVQSESLVWRQHCEELAAQYDVAYLSVDLSARFQAHGAQNFEATARQWRYAALYEALQPDEVLLTAHHQQDQAETVLLQLFRGSGPAGLAAMPAVKHAMVRDYKITHVRPLLRQRLASLQAYAKAHDLIWHEDPSNRDQHHPRNFIRHELLPLLESRWPSMQKLLARTAAHCAEADALVNALAAMDLSTLDLQVTLPELGMHGRVDASVSVQALQALTQSRQVAVLRFWLKNTGVPALEHRRLHVLLQQVLSAASDRMPMLAWQGYELRRYQDRLYVMTALSEMPADWEVAWDGHEPLVLPGQLGYLRWKQCLLTAEATQQSLQAQAYTVRFRRGGERFIPAGRRHHVALKKWLQDQRVPPWWRERIPLVYSGQYLVAIGFQQQGDEVK